MNKQRALEIILDGYNLLKEVPGDKWINGFFTNHVDSCCVIGHYTRLTSDTPESYSYNICDDERILEEYSLREACNYFGINIAGVNNKASDDERKRVVMERLEGVLDDNDVEIVERWKEIPAPVDNFDT